MGSLEQVYLAEKEIGHFPGWSDPEPETHYLWFNAPIEIAGITEAGLVLHGGCLANQPNCHVSFELCFLKKPGQLRIPLERLDWRSLHGGHSNQRYPKSQWSGIRVSNTHLHDFNLNYDNTEQRMRAGGLKVAREINDSLETFVEARNFIGQRFNITNIQVVTEPAWVYDLFAEGEF